ncbi:hypothetical protein LINPERHAP1_LOCUS26912, partial [Linum perenne]
HSVLSKFRIPFGHRFHRLVVILVDHDVVFLSAFTERLLQIWLRRQQLLNLVVSVMNCLSAADEVMRTAR